jgi:hypothetical protein
MAGPPTGYKLFQTVLKGRSDFNEAAFNQMLDGYGLDCIWEQAADCPCRNNDQTDQPDINCPVCDGTGTEYYNPIQLQAVFADAGTFEPDELNQMGQYWHGDLVATVRPEFTMGFLDRVTLRNSVIWFSETVPRLPPSDTRVINAGGYQPLRYPVASRSIKYVRDDDIECSDILVENVDRLTFFRGRSLVVAERDVDFQVTDDGWIDFSLGDANGNAPAVNQLFSIRYFFNPVFVVTSHKPYPAQNLYTETLVPAKTLQQLPISVSLTFDFRMGKRD